MKPYFETELGKLYCGDCLEIMPEIEPVDLILTDPPYNAKKDYGEFKDNLSLEEYQNRITRVAIEAQRIANNQAWIAPRYQMAFYLSLFPKAHIIVVRRGARGPFRGGWSDQFETILVTGKPNKCEIDLWEDIRLKGEGYFFREDTFGHPGYTPYPILFRCAGLLSKTSVCDPYFGTGGTGVACEQLNRKWIGIEQEERWCEIAAKRIEHETQQLKLFGSNQCQKK